MASSQRGQPTPGNHPPTLQNFLCMHCWYSSAHISPKSKKSAENEARKVSFLSLARLFIPRPVKLFSSSNFHYAIAFLSLYFGSRFHTTRRRTKVSLRTSLSQDRASECLFILNVCRSMSLWGRFLSRVRLFSSTLLFPPLTLKLFNHYADLCTIERTPALFRMQNSAQ